MSSFRAAGLCLLFALSGFAGTYEEALRAYRQTDYTSAVTKLAEAKDAQGVLLLGQSYFMLGDYKKASETLDRAAELNPNSNAYTWLGRAWGRRAETAFPMAAPGYASKARANFEKAVELDPGNLEAVDDLFEYYLSAPGFLGGGTDKALKLIDLIAKKDPAEASFARARVAMEKKQFDTAEQQLRRAAQLAPQHVGFLLDLGKFLARRGRFEESDQTFAKAKQVAPDSPKVLYSHASALIESRRNLPEARELLKRYLASNIGPEDPAKTDAEKLLKKVSGS